MVHDHGDLTPHRPARNASAAAQQALLQTRAEIQALAAEHHAALPPAQAALRGAVYARYSTRFQGSIADQVRSMLEEATKRGIHVAAEHIFFDLAVRGGKHDRAGLNQLRAVLEQRQVRVLLLFSTSRLFRRLHHALAFVDQVVKEWGIRCLFVKSAIDTADPQKWEMLLQMHGMIDQFSVTTASAHVRAAHEGLFDKGQVHGTLPFGYTGVPVAGTLTRRNLPRRRIAVDETAAAWVRRVYAWYGTEGVPITTIVQRLNAEPGIPLPPKATTGRWTYLAVHRLLQNPRYRGQWLYGEKENTWVSSKDYARQVKRPEPLRQEQFEELRVVADELWYIVQQRLAGEQHRHGGRRPRDGDRASRPRVLNGLLFCPAHDRPLHVGGAHGKVMFCPGCRVLPTGDRPLYSQLNRVVALQRTCTTLANLMRQDAALVGAVVAACQAEVAALQQPDPARLAALRTQAERLGQKIAFNQRNVGSSAEDEAETARLLQELRAERTAALAQLKALEAGRARGAAVPSAAEVRGLLTELAAILAAAAEGSAAQANRVREVIRLLTGGRIVLEQQGERRRHGGWLRGRFTPRLLPFLVQHALRSSAVTTEEVAGNEVVIDYRGGAEQAAERERAKELYDQGLLCKDIAAELGCGRSYVTRLLQDWQAAHGQALVDGRRRRPTLQGQQPASTPAALAEPAKELWDEGLADVQIAVRLRCRPATAQAAVEHWHRARNLQPPEDVERRAELLARMQALHEQGHNLREIARAVGLCARDVTLLLRAHYQAQGKVLPNGQARRRGKPRAAAPPSPGSAT